MKTWKKLLASAASIIGISLASGSTGSSGAAHAAGAPNLKKMAELACQEALKKDTIEALEEFLRKYGQVDTTCTALALEALEDFNDFRGGGDGKGNPGGGYGE